MIAKEIDIGVDEEAIPVTYESILEVVDDAIATGSSQGMIDRKRHWGDDIDRLFVVSGSRRPHNFIFGNQEQIRKIITNIANRYPPIEQPGPQPTNLNDEFFYFDDMIRMLHEFWKEYRPGGEELDEFEVNRIILSYRIMIITNYWISNHRSERSKRILSHRLSKSKDMLAAFDLNISYNGSSRSAIM